MDKQKPRDYCFRHSKMYEGWQCPMCADEDERGTGSSASTASKSAAPQPGSAAGGAPAAPYRPPSRDQSKTKSDQAEAMLLSGAAREALDLCESAVELDPRNLHAQLVAARASRILRDVRREQDCLEDAIKLLKTDEYARTTFWYQEILKYTRDSFAIAQVARIFASARKWPPADALAMVKSLVGRGAVSDALVVLDSIGPEDRSLLTCAYSMQLTASTYGRVDPDLQVYLQGTPAAQRARILAEMLDVKASEVMAGATSSKIRDAVRTRYEEWTTDIKHLLSEEARKVATDRIAPKINGPAASWAVKFAVGAIVVSVILVGALGLGAGGLVIALVAAVGAAGAGFAYGRDVETKRLLPDVLPGVREELSERELARWGWIMSDEQMDEASSAPVSAETCAYCGAPVPADATTCPGCSRPLHVEETPDAPEATGGDVPATDAPAPSPDEPGPGGPPDERPPDQLG
jgi:hypothetical protein